MYPWISEDLLLEAAHWLVWGVGLLGALLGFLLFGRAG